MMSRKKSSASDNRPRYAGGSTLVVFYYFTFITFTTLTLLPESLMIVKI